jgi:hypothetical protein
MFSLKVYRRNTKELVVVVDLALWLGAYEQRVGLGVGVGEGRRLSPTPPPVLKEH